MELSLPVALPAGMTYEDNFLTPEEEQDLVGEIQSLTFSQIEMHGVVAKRRVAHFGVGYEYNSRNLREAMPLPDFLDALRRKVETKLSLGDDSQEAPSEPGGPSAEGVSRTRKKM